jgi:hypothetical protein
MTRMTQDLEYVEGEGQRSVLDMSNPVYSEGFTGVSNTFTSQRRACVVRYSPFYWYVLDVLLRQADEKLR